MVQKYLKSYEEYLHRHGLYTRLSKLEKEVTEGTFLTKKQIREYEFIDQARLKGMVQAELRCRLLKVGQVEWTLPLQQAMDTHRYWILVLLRYDGHNINARRLIRMAASLGLSAPNVMPRDDLVKHIYDAQVNYNELKNNAPQNRGTWLDGLAMARSEAGMESATKAIKVMRQKEKQRKDNRIINRVMKPSTRRPLSMVQTLSATKQVLSHVTQSSIEDAGLGKNERRF